MRGLWISIKKKVGQLLGLCVDKRVDLRTRLFRILQLMEAAICLVTTLGDFFWLRAGIATSVYPFIGFLALIFGFFLTLKVKDCRKLFVLMIFITNCIIIPLAFFYTGGLDGGVPAWMIFGLMLVFIFLNGVRFYVMFAVSVFSFLCVYLAGIYHPELIRPLSSHTTAMLSSFFCMVTISILAGIIFYFQSRLYNKERVRSEERQRTIQQISDSRNLFFANMSHEIRTPINTIIGFNEMTLREDISDEVAENAANIQNASKILLALINDILDLSKIESGKMKIVPVQYDAGSLFSDLVNIIWFRAHEKKLDFHIDIAEDIPSVLYGDEVRIKQVLVNLLTNAVKYTQKGSVRLTVKGEPLEGERVRLKMSVQDTGIGIRRENMEDLFSTFRRVDEEQNRRIEGTGLGLSISRQLVEMMGGTITVDSIYTKGSVFTVTLEQGVISSVPLGSMQYAAARSVKERPKYRRRFEAPEARVLVVDDNEMNLLVAKKLLRDTRVQVDTAMSGREALSKTLTSYYHVILMDHVMPEMDGEDTLKALRKRSEGFCQDTPVIALTANVMADAENRYREKGFDGYLAKPISGAALETALQSFLPSELLESAEEDEGEMIVGNLSSMMIHGKKKMRVRITTDCVCDLPEAWLEKYGVRVMYYYITTEEGNFRDVAEITSENLLEYIDRGHAARSVPASSAEYETFFADNLMEAEQVIHLSMSAFVSRGFEMASHAAQGFGNVRVLDSGHLSGGLGLMTLWAAKMVMDGADADDVCQAVRQLQEKVCTSFVVPSPDNLYRSGRMSRNIWRLSHLLHLRPVLRLYYGRMLPARVYAGSMDSAARRYVRSQLRQRRKIDDRVLLIVYVGCSIQQLKEIRAEVEKCMTFQTVRFQPATSAIAINCGVGAFGLLYLLK